MANFNPISTWSTPEVQHFTRRAGFGITPEQAINASNVAPGLYIDQWIDGSAVSTLFNSIYANRSDVVPMNGVNAQQGNASNVSVGAVTGDHGFLCEGSQVWRGQLSVAQAAWAFRMQYSPDSFRERLALFWHQFFATGYDKVDNTALMLDQITLFRNEGMGEFTNLLVAVSKSAAMCLWLDSVLNTATTNQTPNENYAREVLELYSLGVDNGYSQQDVTSLAKALSGWSFYVAPGDVVINPTDVGIQRAQKATFAVYQGQAVPAGSRNAYMGTLTNNRLFTQHPTSAANATGGTATISFLGRTFDYTVAPAGMVAGEDVLRSIITSRPTQCSEYLSRRILTHFVHPNPASQDILDFAQIIRDTNFHIGNSLKILFKSQYFFDPAHRFTLISSPIVWFVTATRMLGYSLSEADALSPRGFSAWRLLIGFGEYDSSTLENLGLALLDPLGPNGWGEHTFWNNSNMMRYRSYAASALALKEFYRYTISPGGGAPAQSFTITLVPTEIAKWFSVVPTTSLEAFNRLAALLQLAPMPSSVRDAWLMSLFGGNAVTINLSTHENKIRELAFLMLSAPSGQLH